MLMSLVRLDTYYMTFLFDDNFAKHMGRTTYYQDTRAEDTADSAGSGAIDDEDIPDILLSL